MKFALTVFSRSILRWLWQLFCGFVCGPVRVTVCQTSYSRCLLVSAALAISAQAFIHTSRCMLSVDFTMALAAFLWQLLCGFVCGAARASKNKKHLPFLVDVESLVQT